MNRVAFHRDGTVSYYSTMLGAWCVRVPLLSMRRGDILGLPPAVRGRVYRMREEAVDAMRPAPPRWTVPAPRVRCCRIYRDNQRRIDHEASKGTNHEASKGTKVLAPDHGFNSERKTERG